MKIIILSLLGVSAASASVLESFFGINRGLADVCLTETADLFVDTEMSPAFEAVNDEIDGMASCSMDNSIASCTVDFDTFDSAEEFTEVCSDMGGLVIKVSAEIECLYETTPTSPVQLRRGLNGFTLDYDNLLDCVSDSCVDDNLAGKISETLKNTALGLGKRLNVECSSSIGDYSIVMDGVSIEEPETDGGVAVEELEADGGVTVEGPDINGGWNLTVTIEETIEEPGTDGGVTVEDQEINADVPISPVEDTAKEIKDSSSAGQCRTLMTATAIISALVPLAI